VSKKKESVFLKLLKIKDKWQTEKFVWCFLVSEKKFKYD